MRHLRGLWFVVCDDSESCPDRGGVSLGEPLSQSLPHRHSLKRIMPPLANSFSHLSRLRLTEHRGEDTETLQLLLV